MHHYSNEMLPKFISVVNLILRITSNTRQFLMFVLMRVNANKCEDMCTCVTNSNRRKTKRKLVYYNV